MSELIFSLIAPPSFIDGLARVLDMGGWLNIYNTSRSEEEADIRALRSDWEAISKDMREIIESEKQKFENSTSGTK